MNQDPKDARGVYIQHGKDAVRASVDAAEPFKLEAATNQPPEAGNLTLRERAYALRFDPDAPPPPEEICMAIGDYPIGSRGNLTGAQGKSKSGKSTVISAIIGAAHRGRFQAGGDTLCIEWVDDANGAIIHLDTEQSRADWHALVRRGIARSGLARVDERLVSIPLVMFATSERMEILRQTLEFERAKRGSIDAVIIDGLADLCKSPNDEEAAIELISRLMALAQEYNCMIVCVLHENPGTDQGKTRGHLGSELNRKAFANLRIDKDSETLVSTMWGTDMRKKDIPKEQGFCFAWDDAAGMHTFQGRAAGLKAATAQKNAEAKARAEWEPIFDYAAEIGTNGPCPDFSPDEAAKLERDMNGTQKLTTTEAMKKRMQRAETIGVLKKTKAGRWTLRPSGQSGQTGQNNTMSQA